MKMILSLLFFLLSVLLPAQEQGLRLPAVIGDHMVLQQNEKVAIWGWADPSAKIKVTSEWDGKTVKTKADKDGCWSVTLKTPRGGYDPYVITVTDGADIIDIKDVLIGEVWLCSGQSNMYWQVKQTTDLVEEKNNAARIAKGIRLFSTGKKFSKLPQDDIKNASWERCTSKSVASFSAVGYAFGLELEKKLGVPVGLIQAAYGGTFLEGWLSPDLFENHPKSSFLQRGVAQINKRKNKWLNKEGTLHNANIHPLLKYRIAGTIWYQGCANVLTNPVSYRECLSVLVESWREQFNNPDMPFYIVQIAPHTYSGVNGAMLRESQAFVADNMEHCEIVVTNDCQDIPGDIHPRQKKVVASRLAACALGEHYAVTDEEWRSPAFESMEVVGNCVNVKFANLPSSLEVRGEKIIGFQLAEEDEDGRLKFHLADAVLDLSGRMVTVTSADVMKPAAVRYCYDESIGNLFSAEGLPVRAFRTDVVTNPIAQSARAYFEPPVRTRVMFEGPGYQKVTVENGVKLWTDRTMTLVEGSWPEQFKGFEMLINEGVQDGKVTKGGRFRALEDGYVYYLGRINKATRASWYKDDWRLVFPASFNAAKRLGTKEDGSPEYKMLEAMFVVIRKVQKGEVVEVPVTDSWFSLIPLAGSIEYTDVEL